jgi:hypothetical protein
MKNAAILLLVSFAAIDVCAQGGSPSFEVASVKENRSGSQNSSTERLATVTAGQM